MGVLRYISPLATSIDSFWLLCILHSLAKWSFFRAFSSSLLWRQPTHFPRLPPSVAWDLVSPVFLPRHHRSVQA